MPIEPLAFELVLFDLEGTLVRPSGEPMPHALATLEFLRAHGVRTGVASNCSRAYLDAKLTGTDLGRRIDASRCLDSPGVSSKADMLEQLTQELGTRSALMVGDRDVDWRAAQENALPFVLVNEHALGEAPAIVRLGSLAELFDVLAWRARWIESALEALGLVRGKPRLKGLGRLGITGRPCSGKTIFAQDVARFLRARGVACQVVPLDAFRRIPCSQPLQARHAARAQAAGFHDPLEACFDIDALLEQVLEPHARGELAVPKMPGVPPLAPDQLLIVEGEFLLHPRLRVFLDRSVYLDVDLDTALERVVARARSHAGVAAAKALRTESWPLHESFEQRFDPRSRADLVLDARDPLQRMARPA